MAVDNLNKSTGSDFLSRLRNYLAHHLRKGRRDTEKNRLISFSQVNEALTQGWKDSTMSYRQREIVDCQLRKMYSGDVMNSFKVAAEAVASCGFLDGLLVEIGCASGYYCEVLPYLLRKKINYIGLDYSLSMVELAGKIYNQASFIVGDANVLPFADKSIDILLSGNVLVHARDYETVISESARVSKGAVIFHLTPVMKMAKTAYLTMYAYGVKVVRLSFNQDEFLCLLDKYGLLVENIIELEPYSIKGIEDAIIPKTFVCRVKG
ncbi:MAG: class I SAM-dependent methyltransferase [Candidatus Omnitrophica bacterium]|nr:class I SAM-dependent methyltransferase [Candidatus Omnitrophota bacterium]MBU1870179.1 class I SAM-dependent methyltransferase [Candidatus Omnitrophota bacterium]